MVLARVTNCGLPTMAAPDKPTGEAFDFVSDLADALVNEQIGVSMLNYGAAGDGVADDEPEISSALTAAVAADNKWLLFPPGTYLCNSDITFTVPVLFTGGVLKLAAGVTITFNEPYMNLGGQQCFDEQGRLPNAAGGVRIALNNPQTVVRPTDWGADSTGAGDSFAAIQQAIDSFDYVPSADKTGVVEFLSGKYLLTQGVFVGYDFNSTANFQTQWDNRSAANTLILNLDSDETLRPTEQKQRVVLRGLGRVILRGSGAPPSPLYNNYLLYYAGSGYGEGHTILDNLTFNGNSWQWRGAYVGHQAYADSIRDVGFTNTIEVGLDWVDSWSSRLVNVFGRSCRGHVVRAWQANGGEGAFINAWAGAGFRNEHWPSKDETHIVDVGGDPVQTPVTSRAALFLDGSSARWSNLLIESCEFGSPMGVTVAADLFTCTEAGHGLASTDPIWVPDSATKAQTVTTPITASTFTLGTAAVAGSDKLIYRRATAITQAQPPVVSCQNHGLETGCRVKILPGVAGMVELETNGPWYQITKVNDDSFSLQDFAGADIDATGHTASDGNEYIVTGYPGIFASNNSAKLDTLRFENNKMPYCKVVLPDTTMAVSIDGFGLSDSDIAADWAVVCRATVNGCKFERIRGIYISRAAVLFRPLAGDMASCNWVSQVGLSAASGTYPTQTVEFDLIGTGAQEANYVDGSWTPTMVVLADTTPSIFGDYSGKNVIDYWGFRPSTGLLSVPALYASSITDFDDGFDGMILYVRFLGADATVVQGVPIVLTGGINYSPSAGEMMKFHNVNGVWYEF